MNNKLNYRVNGLGELSFSLTKKQKRSRAKNKVAKKTRRENRK